MQTVAASFNNYRMRQGEHRSFFVHVTIDSVVYIFSDSHDVDADGYVAYPVLKSVTSIKSAFDPLTRAQTTTQAGITLTNHPFSLRSGDRHGVNKRISDFFDLRDWTYASASVYLLAGPRPTDVGYFDTGADSRSHLVFTGKIITAPIYDNNTFSFTIKDIGKVNDMLLPQNLVGDTYGGAPISSFGRKIPLVYGEWRMDDGTNSPLGLAIAEQADQNKEAIYVISDHALDSIEKSYTQIEELSPCLSELVDQDHNVNASGYGTSQLDRWYWTLRALTKLRPIDNFAGPYDAAVLDSNVTNIANALDGDPMSYASLLDYFDDGTTRKARAVFCWGDYSNEENSGETPMGLIIEYGGVEKYVLKIITQREAGILFATQAVKAVYGQTAGTDDETSIGDLTISTVKGTDSFDIGFGTTTAPNLREGWAWHLRSGNKDYKTKDDRITAIGDRDFSDAANWANVDFNAFNKTDDLSVAATAIGQSCELAAAGIAGFVSGNQYRITYDCIEIISGVEWAMGGQTVTVVNGTDQTAAFTATANGTKLVLQSTTNNAFIHIDNVSVVEEDDRTTEDWPYVVRIDLETLDLDTDATGSTLDSTVVKIFDIYLEINHQFSWFGGPVFVACNGREYGSWITGRSSGYADGDAIEDPVGIIESLLREELSLAAVKIDLPSFISAENTSVKARINLHSDNEMKFSEVARQLSEQGTFAFVWTRGGQARCIDLSAAPGSVDKTIRWRDLVAVPKIYVNDFLINELHAEHRYQQESNRFNDQTTYSDATSQAEPHGVQTFSAKWPNITGSSATHVGEHYVKATTGIWSNRHMMIEFSTFDLLHVELEIGDWISLDADVDNHITFNGNTWSGVKFIIISVEVTLNATKFKAMELF